MPGRVRLEETIPIAPLEVVERDVEWRRPMVMDERELQLGELLADQDVDMSALVETEGGTDGTAFHVQPSHRDQVELDEPELEL